jgi:hypothetical protein
MGLKSLSLPVTHVSVDASPTGQPLELWRHALGHGGINSLPLPDRVVSGVRKLGPRLIRIFIQEFFRIYQGSGRFDWSRLDPYMDALGATGAKVVAAVTVKPAPLYPRVDQAQWRPSDVGEWQHVISQLVKRYSVDRPLVTHWEIGNEPDIGEHGGCPYLIPDPQDYGEYYSMTIRPILQAFPQARVGGPAVASIHTPLLPGFIDYCRRTGSQLDFVSWHLYSSMPALHTECVRLAKSLLGGFPGRRPELMVTEWSRGLGGQVSVEEQAYEPSRAAVVAAAVIGMLEAGLDWSFYYHVWDQTCFPDDFAPFFSQAGVTGMARHWNEVPHRLGLFGVCEEVRPQYFLYQMLSGLGDERLAAHSTPDVRVLAGRADGRISVMAVNHSIEESCDRAAVLCFTGLRPGVKRLTVRRIDDRRMWRPDTLELLPVEARDVCTSADFECHVLLPADSVAVVCLDDRLHAEGPR